MTAKRKIISDGRATAEDLAKKIEGLLKEELVGLTKREGANVTFTLAGGQSFLIGVTEKDPSISI